MNKNVEEMKNEQEVTSSSDPSQHHPGYDLVSTDWDRIRDCIQGESVVKKKKEKYLPRPAGMTGEYADAYDSYIERAHFPQICSYALAGALGVVVTKLPEFNVPTELEYILKESTKDGITIQQLFLDIIIEILSTGRCPLVVDIVPDTNEFKFVRYNAEDFINWKSEVTGSEKNLVMAVLEEDIPDNDDIFSHDTQPVYRVFVIEDGKFTSRVFGDDGEFEDFLTTPSYMGKHIDQIPVFVAGSINNSVEIQPIPLLSVANCSIQIYRKEADLANSEYLSCNPTLCLVGASNDDELPNVVGSSVMIVLPDPQARIFYTETDTAALTHVKEHIDSLYEEAIRHGVAILDTRKGVESAEALRIRQATQSATIYSIYLSALNSIRNGLYLMCDWAGFNKEDVIIDAPSALTYGIPDSNIIRETISGFGQGVIPIHVIHRYLIGSGLLEQTISLDEYTTMLEDESEFRAKIAVTNNANVNVNKNVPEGETIIDQEGGSEDELEKEGEKPAPKKKPSKIKNKKPSKISKKKPSKIKKDETAYVA